MALEKQDLREMEARIRGHIDGKFEAHESQEMLILDQFRQEVGDHHKSLYGVNGTPGLTLKVDRLETGIKLWVWLIGTLLAVAGVVSAFL